MKQNHINLKLANVDKVLRLYKKHWTIHIYDYLILKVLSIFKMIYNLLRVRLYCMHQMDKILIRLVVLENIKW